MKDLKVRTKILLGFGIAIAMLLVIVCLFFVTNISTAKNLDVVRLNTDLQSASKNFTLHFLEACIDAEAAHLVKSDAAYTQLSSDIDVMQTDLKKILEQINGNLSGAEYINDSKAIETAFADWIQSITAVKESNSVLRDTFAEIEKQQDILRMTADSTYQNQQAIIQREAYEDVSDDDRFRRAGRLDETVVFIRDIDALIREGGTMFRTFDISNSAEFFTEMDRVIAALQQNGDEARNQETKNTAYATVEALNGYREAIFTFERACADNKADIAESQRTSDIVYEMAEAFFDNLTKSVYTSVDKTISGNNSSIVIAIIIVLCAIAITTAIAFYISELISKPVTVIANYMNKVGKTGDLTLSSEEMTLMSSLEKHKDEMAELSSGANAFIKHVTRVGNDLDLVANGDLTLNLSALSNKDILGMALIKMHDSLNDMFKKILESTEQVYYYAKHSADEAQSLAQGSIQQAESVEQISTLIGNVAVKMRDNTETATRTARMSEFIKDSAEKGSRQMDVMINAVREINDASKSIGKIIKTIDDIAFQTNILALNAAVEAARAGHHGKGFAVVAEEVRSLASKSAEAAKNTGDMIQTSIKKAELGYQVAGETAASLSEIVTNIDESNKMIAEIVNVSQEQTQGISRIYTDIDQVAQVVRFNSATARESAAASEEMSSQSSRLEEIVSQFKLKSDV
jgi:methyl-accepting chemotaxis protein